MQTRAVLTEQEINSMMTAGVAHAKTNGWAVTIAIVDEGGHLLGLARLDNAAAVSAYVATEKARSSALGRRESKLYEDMINQGRTSFLSVPHIQGLLEGGVPVMVQGQCIGAVGVSGVKSEQDAMIAKAAIAAISVAASNS